MLYLEQVTKSKKPNRINADGKQWKCNLINYSSTSAWWKHQYQKV